MSDIDVDGFLMHEFMTKYEAPPNYEPCVACPYSHDPEEDMVQIEDVDDDAVFEYLTEFLADEPEQWICKTCLTHTKREVHEVSRHRGSA